jgi:Membrane bound beta barrel domain (DUF5777)
MFEISHRFLPAVTEKSDALWRLGGPVYNRLGLAYAPTDHVMIGLLRSNLDDNLEFDAKLRLLEGEMGEIGFAVGAMLGIGINFGAIESVNYPHDAVSFGVEIETRGHFFKLLLANQVRMNPAQFLVGTPSAYGGGGWRLGFDVTRLLSF